MESAAGVEPSREALESSYEMPGLYNDSDKKNVPSAIPETEQATSSNKKETNTVLLMFFVMSLAQKVMRENRKDSKQSSQHHERYWGEVSEKISKEHQDTASSQKTWSYAYFASPTILVVGTIAGQQFSSLKTGEVFNSVSTLASQMTQGALENLKITNESKQAPLAMQSQACSSRNQSLGSDESSDKQQLSELDHLKRDLIHQEAQIFQGSTGRG